MLKGLILLIITMLIVVSGIVIYIGSQARPISSNVTKAEFSNNTMPNINDTIIFVGPSGYDYAIIPPDSPIVDHERWAIPPNMNLLMMQQFNEVDIFRPPFSREFGGSRIIAPFTAIMYFIDENHNGEMDLPVDLHFGRIVGCKVKPEYVDEYPDGCIYPDDDHVYMVPGSYQIFASVGGSAGEWIEYEQIQAIFILMFTGDFNRVVGDGGEPDEHKHEHKHEHNHGRGQYPLI